jgi:hypothetical protein
VILEDVQNLLVADPNRRDGPVVSAAANIAEALGVAIPAVETKVQ